MTRPNHQEIAASIRNDLRLKTFPLAVKFLQDTADFPAKTRQPSAVLGKRVTICQAVTMARIYGWTVGLSREDVICVPAMIAFGFSGATDPAETLGKLFCEVEFVGDEQQAANDAADIIHLANNEYEALVLAPLQKGLFDPDTVVFYGNPAQIMRLIQACVYVTGRSVASSFGGKVECSAYLAAPHKTQAPRVVIPGMGDRIFSMTQDDEMVFSIPGTLLEKLAEGLEKAGQKIGARYPVTSYQNFEPEFPKPYKALGEKLGLF